MTNILFWNSYRGSATSFLQPICFENNVDILILSEEPTEKSIIENSLNSIEGLQKYREFSPVKSDIRFFLKNGSGSLHLAKDDGRRISLRTYVDGKGNRALLAGVHLPSKGFSGDTDQAYEGRRLRAAIEETEQRLGIDKTIIIGDMNMSPFEPGMTAADGLHGIMDAEIAKKKSRIFREKNWSYFYNPMWSRMGDESDGPSGTYFSNGSNLDPIHWHTFDQILLRPSLIDAYKKGEISVLTKIGSTPLIKNNKIDKNISDHLPILLSIELGD